MHILIGFALLAFTAAFPKLVLKMLFLAVGIFVIVGGGAALWTLSLPVGHPLYWR